MAKKISRREAIKLLGAVAGASVLANLPSKWKTPEIASGVLPVHAQTSGLTILGQRNLFFNSCGSTVCDFELHSHTVKISSGADLIPMRWKIENVQGGSLGLQLPNSTTGVESTQNGLASLQLSYNGPATSYDLTWTFENPLDGSGSCTVTYRTSNNSFCE